jgi:tyrosyl-tRNA synthetase
MRQVTTPEQLHAELREERRETEALAVAEQAEELVEIAAEAEARADVVTEEAQMWGGVDTDENKIYELLNRAVVDVIVREELHKKLRSGRKLRVKLGIDPTGPHLHMGRTVPLFKLRQFQDMGHQIVLIIGDFTARVGDASDKDSMRPMLTDEQIERNMATYKQQIGKILDLSKVEFRFNSQWLAPLTFADVIRLASRFTVAQMIQRENFSDRWEQGKPIGLHELLYPIMQGFDSVAIEADVEIGGTDQLFNLLAGRTLQEDAGQPPQDIMTLKMIPGTDGRKMSTTWGNAIYIEDDPDDQFGKVMSMNDDVIVLWMEACTRMPWDEVKHIAQALERGSVHPMDAKKRLAWEIVKTYHGEDAANRAREDFERQFQKRTLPTQIPVVPIEKALAQKADERGEIGILDLLVNTGLAPSRKHATRLVEQRAVRLLRPTEGDAEVNVESGQLITDREQRVRPEPGLIIKVGRSFVRIEG